VLIVYLVTACTSFSLLPMHHGRPREDEYLCHCAHIGILSAGSGIRRLPQGIGNAAVSGLLPEKSFQDLSEIAALSKVQLNILREIRTNRRQQAEVLCSECANNRRVGGSALFIFSRMDWYKTCSTKDRVAAFALVQGAGRPSARGIWE
jgi:hypothetical protein